VKILLINPPIEGLQVVASGLVTECLGLGYVASALERDGHDVAVMDALAEGCSNCRSSGEGRSYMGLELDAISQRIVDAAPDLIGIGFAFTIYQHMSLQVARAARKAVPGAVIIAGGNHATVFHRELVLTPDIDLVVRGEGEETTRKIARALEECREWRSIEGITCLDVQGSVQVNPDADFIKDLDEIPPPAHHLMSMDKILEHQERYRHPNAYLRFPIADIITSRGCPGHCAFCSVKTIWKNSWRAHSPERVVSDIEQLVRNFGIREIRIYDDNCTVKKERMIRICQLIIERGLDISFTTPNGVAIWTLDEEVLRWMRKAGYYRMTLGIESGSRDTQKYIGKIINLEKARKIIRTANRLGIWTYSTFVIGFPHEREESVLDTIKFIKESGLDFVGVYLAQPYPGTKLLDDFIKIGFQPDFMNSTSVMSSIATQYHTAEEWAGFRSRIYSEFLKAKIRNVLLGRGILQIALKLRSWELVKLFVRSLRIALGGPLGGWGRKPRSREDKK